MVLRFLILARVRVFHTQGPSGSSSHKYKHIWKLCGKTCGAMILRSAVMLRTLPRSCKRGLGKMKLEKHILDERLFDEECLLRVHSEATSIVHFLSVPQSCTRVAPNLRTNIKASRQRTHHRTPLMYHLMYLAEPCLVKLTAVRLSFGSSGSKTSLVLF